MFLTQRKANAARADRKTTRKRAWSCKIYLRRQNLVAEVSKFQRGYQPRNENNIRDLGLKTKGKHEDNERHPGRPATGVLHVKTIRTLLYGAGAGAGAGSAGAGSAGAGAGSAGAGAAAGASGAGAGAGEF